MELLGVDGDALAQPGVGAAVLVELDGAHLVGAQDDALGEQEAAHEVRVVARRAHDDGERDALEPDLERLLDGHGVERGAAGRGSGRARGPIEVGPVDLDAADADLVGAPAAGHGAQPWARPGMPPAELSMKPMMLPSGSLSVTSRPGGSRRAPR